MGANCTPCHERFLVNDSAVREMFPCVKKPCHDSGTRWGKGERFKVHLNESICMGCHVSINGEYDIHLIHRDQVSCRICHQSFRGWNSTVATISGADAVDIRTVDDVRIAVPKETRCEYCHLSAEEPERLHDVHEPVLDKACYACHTEEHSGQVCITCHESFSLNATEIDPRNCKANGCHSRSASERQELHLKKEMCRNCHPTREGVYDVHLIHHDRVNCRVCHQSFRGWNSSIATIPVPDEEDIIVISQATVPGISEVELREFQGVRMAIPKDRECEYCHLSARYPSRLHDIHQPVLDEACDSCHNRTSVHSGEVCISCHNTFNLTSASIRETNCKENGCHIRTPSERQSLHLEKTMCIRCHNSTGSELDVHTIHQNRVNCRVCHQSFRGWNSSKVSIPAAEEGEIVSLDGVSMYVPRDRDCSFCHLASKAPQRLHDVHAPAQEDICNKCHRNYTFARDGMQEQKSAYQEILNQSIEYFKKPVEQTDMSCDNCHESLYRSFFTDNRTAWLAMLHMWAGNADRFIGPDGEIKFKKNFTTNMESNGCLLCHVVEEVDVYKNTHVKIDFRPCTDAHCHGDENTRGTRTFVDAGYLGLNLASHQDAHSKGFLTSGYRGWRMCVGCHDIHPKEPGFLARLRAFLGIG